MEHKCEKENINWNTMQICVCAYMPISHTENDNQ